MTAIFRLLRFPNLLVVVLVQALLQYRIFLPVWKKWQVEPVLSDLNFWLLTGATCAVTASGYVVNDLRDEAADAINRPKNTVIGTLVSRQSAGYLFFFLVLVGYMLSLLLALRCQERALLWLYPFAVFGLVAYSYYFQRKVLIGNLLVAVFCGAVAGIILLAERDNIATLLEIAPVDVRFIVQFTTLYALFAFFTTLCREIIKDIEDRVGDAAVGYRTLAVHKGVYWAKAIATLSGVLLVGVLLIPVWLFPASWVTLSFRVYISGLAVALFVLSIIQYRAQSQQDFRRLSRWWKLYMVAGIFLLLLV